jgi:hypothetical protein
MWRFDYIPAQSGRSIDAEAGVVGRDWWAVQRPHLPQVLEETVNENNDTEILMRTSTNDGATRSAPVRGTTT